MLVQNADRKRGVKPSQEKDEKAIIIVT